MPNLSPLYGLLLAKQAQLQADIIAGTITGIERSAVRVLEEPRTVKALVDDAQYPPPTIIMCPAQLAEEIRPMGQGGGQANDEIGYPVQVVMIAIEDATDRDRDMDWRANLRDKVMDRFREQATTLTDPVASFHRSRVVPGPMLNHTQLNQRSLWVSAFVAYHYLTRLVPA